MGQLKDLVVTGATRLLGKITTKDVEINGGLIINPGSKANHNEGIRINKSNAGWATLVLGGEPGSTSGTGSGIWSMHAYNGNFYLSHNGSDNGSPMIKGDKSGSWNIFGRVTFNNGITMPTTICSILFRDDDSWASWVSHETMGNEALVFGTNNAATSFIFANNINRNNIASNQWASISTPGLQIKNNCVSIGELIANDVTPSYKLTVNGDVNIKGGINISGTLNGTASKANTLNITNGNEINFSGSSGIVWFNYRNPDTGNYSGNTNITSYIFANRNGSEKGVTLVTDDIKVLIDNESVSLKTYVSNGKGMVAGAITGMGVSTEPSATFETMAAKIRSITPTLVGYWNGTTFIYGAHINNEHSITDSTKVGGDVTADCVLYGQTFSSNSAGRAVMGTMPNNGAVSPSPLNCNGSYTIPAGYHNGSGKVTAASLSSQTPATATAATILSGYTAWVSGSKITGSMPNNGAVSPSALNCGGSYTIPKGYHNGSGKVTAASLSSQTPATATAATILSGYTAWVSGSKITGNMPTAKSIASYTFNGSYFVKLNSLSQMPGSGSGGGLGTKIPKAYFDGENDYIEFATDTFGDAEPSDVVYGKTFTGLYPSAKLSGTMFNTAHAGVKGKTVSYSEITNYFSVNKGGNVFETTYAVATTVNPKLNSFFGVDNYRSGDVDRTNYIFLNKNKCISIIASASYMQYYCVILWYGDSESNGLYKFTVLYKNGINLECQATGSSSDSSVVYRLGTYDSSNLVLMTVKL